MSTEREKLIEKLKSRFQGRTTGYGYGDIADFILADRKRIVEICFKRINALEKLLGNYRTGTRPTEKLLMELDRAEREFETLKNAGVE